MSKLSQEQIDNVDAALFVAHTKALEGDFCD